MNKRYVFNYVFGIFFTLIIVVPNPVFAAPLITAKESSLPAASGTFATRGISRGPSVKLNSPEADTLINSPFDFKVLFEARGEGKIDPNSVKVVYMKSPFVDLTPRLKSAITPTGINFSKAEVPPGTHTIRVTVKDMDGRETNQVITLVVNK
jgi:hypothetical protein